MKDKPQNKAEPKKSVFSRMGVMNIVLIFIAVTLISFTVVMIELFKIYGTIPDTLCTCVFSVLGTECGALAWIKNTKEKHRDRSIELEDRKYYEEKEKAERSIGFQDTTAQQEVNGYDE